MRALSVVNIHLMRARSALRRFCHRQGGSPAGGDRLLEPSGRPRPLDVWNCWRAQRHREPLILDVNRPWRKVKVTERWAAEDFAACMRELADVHYPCAERVRVVLDNLSTHSPGALYQTFPPDQARRILRRLEFHYVPKHASWLNMVEIGSASWPANASIDASTATLGSSPKPQPGLPA